MEELLLENMRLTVRAEAAEEELAEVEREKESLLDFRDKQKDEIFQLKAWLAAAHENANVKSHNEAAGVLIEENDRLQAENARLKADQADSS